MNRNEWYVLYTRPRHEKKLAATLGRMGLTSYLPLQRLKRKWSDREKLVEEPLFKGYLFLQIDYTKDRLAALKLPGALYFVMFEGKPASVDPKTIESLKILESKAALLEVAPATAFTPGDEVIVTQGPFKGIRAQVERRKNQNRLLVRLPLLNQIVFTDVDAWDLQKD